MKRIVLVALALACGLTAAPAAKACNPKTLALIQGTYGSSAFVRADRFGAEVVFDDFGRPIARIDAIDGFESLTPLNGVYASRGVAFVRGSPYIDPDLAVFDAAFLARQVLRREALRIEFRRRLLYR